MQDKDNLINISHVFNYSTFLCCINTHLISIETTFLRFVFILNKNRIIVPRFLIKGDYINGFVFVSICLCVSPELVFVCYLTNEKSSNVQKKIEFPKLLVYG